MGIMVPINIDLGNRCHGIIGDLGHQLGTHLSRSPETDHIVEPGPEMDIKRGSSVEFLGRLSRTKSLKNDIGLLDDVRIHGKTSILPTSRMNKHE